MFSNHPLIIFLIIIHNIRHPTISSNNCLIISDLLNKQFISSVNVYCITMRIHVVISTRNRRRDIAQLPLLGRKGRRNAVQLPCLGRAGWWDNKV
ncbi:hypothetical protein V476_08870 [Pseudomonas syringae KCTC 12500]|nr:hypothetical protein V476_08870 [Pseudomonas syringae KCTC 12500]POR83094.1 hypothetical protein BKM21_24800 [Pseudomonas syringae pv. syringae]